MSGRLGRVNFREALGIYITEHDRVRREEPRPEPSDKSKGADEEEDPTLLEATGSPTADGGWTTASPPRPRFGVGIPDRLDFHRGPATWRPSGAPGTRRPGGPDGF